MLTKISCPVCNADNYKVILKIKERNNFYNLNRDILFSIVKCKSCSMIYVNPTLDNTILAEIYSSGMLPFKQSFEETRQVEYQRVIKRIKKIKPTGRILDVGSGHGHLLKIARNHGYQALGIEINKKGYEYSKSQGLEVINDYIENAELKDNHFDIVILFHLLEHTTNPSSILSEVFRVLKKDGLLVVAFPNVNCWRRLIKGKKWEGWHPVEHILYFSFPTLKKLLEKTGFRIIQKPYIAKFPKPKKTMSEQIITILVFLKDYLENKFNIYPKDLLIYARK